MGINWTDGLCEALTERVAEGKAFSVIADELSALFSVEMSRNSAIGRAGRMGLVSKKEKKPPKERKSRATRSGEHHALFKIRRIGSGMGTVETRESMDRPNLRCVEVVSRRLSLLDLEPNDCRWPDADSENPTTFCGNPKWSYLIFGIKRESSYCRLHYELSVGAGTGSERAAHKIGAAA